MLYELAGPGSRGVPQASRITRQMQLANACHIEAESSWEWPARGRDQNQRATGNQQVGGSSVGSRAKIPAIIGGLQALPRHPAPSSQRLSFMID